MVFQAAGILPPEPERTEELDLLDHIFLALPKDAQDELITFGRFKQEQYRQQEEAEKARRRKTKPAT